MFEQVPSVKLEHRFRLQPGKSGMDDLSLCVLAADDEYLIALDVEYLLQPLSWCRVEVTTTPQIDQALGNARAAFDLVLFDPEPVRDRLATLIESINRIGAVPVLGTVEGLAGRSYPGAETAIIVRKPYSERTLRAAFAKALAGAQRAKLRAVAAAIAASGP